MRKEGTEKRDGGTIRNWTVVAVTTVSDVFRRVHCFNLVRISDSVFIGNEDEWNNNIWLLSKINCVLKFNLEKSLSIT
jgi:hypothetical protein